MRKILTIKLTQPILSFHGLLGLFCPKLETFSAAFFHFGSNPRVEESFFTWTNKILNLELVLILVYLPPKVLHEYYSDDEDQTGSKTDD